MVNYLSSTLKSAKAQVHSIVKLMDQGIMKECNPALTPGDVPDLQNTFFFMAMPDDILPKFFPYVYLNWEENGTWYECGWQNVEGHEYFAFNRSGWYDWSKENFNLTSYHQPTWSEYYPIDEEVYVQDIKNGKVDAWGSVSIYTYPDLSRDPVLLLPYSAAVHSIPGAALSVDVWFEQLSKLMTEIVHHERSFAFVLDAKTGHILAHTASASLIEENVEDSSGSSTTVEMIPATEVNGTLVAGMAAALQDRYGNYTRVPANPTLSITVDGEPYFAVTEVLLEGPLHWLLLLATPCSVYLAASDAALVKLQQATNQTQAAMSISEESTHNAQQAAKKVDGTIDQIEATTRQVNARKTAVLIIAIAVCVLVWVAILLLLLLLIRPMQRLSQEMSRVAHLEVEDPNVPSSFLAEVSSMAGAFLQMGVVLKEYKKFMPQALFEDGANEEGEEESDAPEPSPISRQHPQSLKSHGGSSRRSGSVPTSARHRRYGPRASIVSSGARAPHGKQAHPLHTKRGVFLVCQLRGNDLTSDIALLECLHAFVLHDVLGVVKHHGGIVAHTDDTGFVAHWGLVSRLDRVAALRAACEIHALARPERLAGVSLHLGLATGAAISGSIITPTTATVLALGRPLHVARALAAPALQGELGVGTIMDGALRQQTQGDFKSEVCSALPRPQAPAQSDLVYALLGAKATHDPEDEWMYQLEAQESADGVTQAFQAFAKGLLQQAQDLSDQVEGPAPKRLSHLQKLIAAALERSQTELLVTDAQ